MRTAVKSIRTQMSICIKGMRNKRKNLDLATNAIQMELREMSGRIGIGTEIVMKIETGWREAETVKDSLMQPMTDASSHSISHTVCSAYTPPPSLIAYIKFIF